MKKTCNFNYDDLRKIKSYISDSDCEYSLSEMEMEANKTRESFLDVARKAILNTENLQKKADIIKKNLDETVKKIEEKENKLKSTPYYIWVDTPQKNTRGEPIIVRVQMFNPAHISLENELEDLKLDHSKIENECKIITDYINKYKEIENKAYSAAAKIHPEQLSSLKRKLKDAFDLIISEIVTPAERKINELLEIKFLNNTPQNHLIKIIKDDHA